MLPDLRVDGTEVLKLHSHAMITRSTLVLLASIAGAAALTVALALQWRSTPAAATGPSLPTYQEIKVSSLERARAAPTVPCSADTYEGPLNNPAQPIGFE